MDIQLQNQLNRIERKLDYLLDIEEYNSNLLISILKKEGVELQDLEKLLHDCKEFYSMFTPGEIPPIN